MPYEFRAANRKHKSQRYVGTMVSDSIVIVQLSRMILVNSQIVIDSESWEGILPKGL
jgi:hypothetical protein